MDDRLVIVMKNLGAGTINDSDLQFMNAQTNLPLSSLRRGHFDEPFVRGYAMLRLGKSGYPGLLGWFNSFDKQRLQPAEVEYIWPAIQVAKCQLEYDLLSERQRFEYLEAHFDDRSDNDSSASVHTWAINMACNSGFENLSGSIRKALMERNPAAGERRAKFCEDRVRVVNRLSNREQSLLSFLDDYSNSDPVLVEWAIEELQEYRQPSVKDALEKSAKGIRALPESSEVKRRFLYVAEVASPDASPTQYSGSTK